MNEAKRPRVVEDENRRLKEMVADLSLDREAWTRPKAYTYEGEAP